MKLKIWSFLLTAGLLILVASCGKDDDDVGSIGGSQSPIGSIGNEFTISQIQGTEDVSATVTSLKDGISTISLSGRLIGENLKELAGLIPDFNFGSYDPETGDFTGNLKLKFSSEGIVDYLNVAERPFVLAKFGAKVGDTYTCEKASGGVFTRTVTEVSEEDNFPYEGMLIKTITVEELGRNVAINRIVYKVNHKFGLVYASVIMQDGSTATIYLHSGNSN